MYETLQPVSIYLVNSIAGGIYIRKFLKERYPGKISLFLWTGLYLIFQCTAMGFLSGAYPFNDILKAAADIIVILALQMLLYKKDLLKQLFVTVSFIAGREIIKYIIVALNDIQYWMIKNLLISALSNSITTMKEAEAWNFIIRGVTWLIFVSVYAVLMIAYLSLISRKFVRKDYPLKTHEYAFLMLPSAAALCISITLKMLIISVENDIATAIYERVPAAKFWVPLICFLLLGVNVSSVMLFQKLVQCNEEERKRVTLENQMVQMHRQIEEIQDIYADMRGLRHDMRNHLESISALVKRTSGSDRTELDGYIGKMEETVDRLDLSYRTGNPITDVIIHQKKQEAEKRGISFDADFTYPDRQQIDVYDIGIVLNNALENAIEASSQTPGEKNIRLRSYMKGNLFFIEVENNFIGDLVIDNETGLPVSSKKDRQLHGLGIENIRRCAKKYMGDIDISIQESGDRKKFCLTVMMYERYFTPEMQ
ncbi:MAG: GHKL domain-containing protein [Oscillospiraceae bacterium]|nr:GHKL domain-containing protein [Oscillospiraceae bacterium]